MLKRHPNIQASHIKKNISKCNKFEYHFLFAMLLLKTFYKLFIYIANMRKYLLNIKNWKVGKVKSKFDIKIKKKIFHIFCWQSHLLERANHFQEHKTETFFFFRIINVDKNFINRQFHFRWHFIHKLTKKYVVVCFIKKS